MLQSKTLNTAKDVQNLIDQTEKEAKRVDEIHEAVEVDKEVANTKTAEAKAVRDEVEAELAKALPQMEEATTALDTLTPKDMTQLKQMIKPANSIRLVMEAICIMKEVKPDKMLVKTEIGDMRSVDDYWTAARRMLKDIHFLDSLKEYNKDNISPEIMKVIREDYITKPDFDPVIIKKVYNHLFLLLRNEWSMNNQTIKYL